PILGPRERCVAVTLETHSLGILRPATAIVFLGLEKFVFWRANVDDVRGLGSWLNEERILLFPFHFEASFVLFEYFLLNEKGIKLWNEENHPLILGCWKGCARIYFFLCFYCV
ncbi:hypothetical protein V8G54_002117, partial [Vigna mungo]